MTTPVARRTRRTGTGPDPTLITRALDELLRVCTAVSEGDFETRVMLVEGAQDEPQLVAMRNAMNRMIDRTDAFVRESAGTLTAASEGRHYRRFLLGGTAGTLRAGAVTINRACDVLAESSGRIAIASQARLRLADEFEGTVMAVAEQVAAAARDLSSSAVSLATSATAAVRDADSARAAIASMEDSSREIQQIVTLISRVAAQTRLLSLNATIEAARAGEAGKGFAVVASEVKQLAGQTAEATEAIVAQVGAVQATANHSAGAMETVGQTVRDMDSMVNAISSAVDGAGPASTHDGTPGLAQVAEVLRAEVERFLANMRQV